MGAENDDLLARHATHVDREAEWRVMVREKRKREDLAEQDVIRVDQPEGDQREHTRDQDSVEHGRIAGEAKGGDLDLPGFKRRNF